MKEKILIVEDQFVEADYLRLMLTKAGYHVAGIARSVIQAQVMIGQDKPDFVLLDIFLKGKLTGIDLAKELAASNIPFVYLSANSNEEVLNAAKATQPYGFLVKPFRENDLLVTLEIARYRHEHSLESRHKKIIALEQQLNNMIQDNSGWQEKLLQTGTMLQPYIPFDFLSAGLDNLQDADCVGCSFLRIGFNEYQTIGTKELLTIGKLSMSELLKLHAASENKNQVAFFNDQDFESISHKPTLHQLFRNTFQVRSHLVLPLQLPNGKQFSFCFYSRRPDTYHAEHIDLFHRLQQTWEKSIGKIFSTDHDNKPPVKQEPAPLQAAGAHLAGFEGIIGNSHLLLNAFDHITQVAPFDTSVLILGESGTGKERIADCIHDLSPRKGKPLIKVNCAALPANLIESELFGHEKGSFTGATDKRIGKFQQADGGTIFLDEIGELPSDLQAKLLRVLQEREIEPIGCKSIVRINVRIIAATNRNLEKEVAEGRFRLDLYYRLNVFPITLPPLRKRKEDIAELVSHFIVVYNRKTGKKITAVSDKVMTRLMAYHWPGNIRELENTIERSVLLAKNTVIEDIQLPENMQQPSAETKDDSTVKTIFENERDHILAILKKANGKIWGSGGAAELLNLPPTTLSSKMKKLGIKKIFGE